MRLALLSGEGSAHEPPRFATRLNSFVSAPELFWPALSGRPGVLAMVERAATVQGLTDLDLNFPDHVGEEPEALAGRVADLGLSVNGLAMRFYTNPAFKRGAFTNPEKAVRREAIELTRRGIDAARAMGTDLMTLWLGQDGFDYNFQIDYAEAWDWEIEGIREVAAHDPDCLVSIEYKPDEPRAQSLLRDAATTLLAIAEADKPNLGVTLDFAHSLYAGEQPAFAAHLIHRRSRLLGVHLNDAYAKRDDGLMVGAVHGARHGGLVLAEADKPSIAVLPFANMSGDPEQQYFADGLVEDVITNLSKVAGLFVIARNSSFAYRGRQVDIRQVARELGVRYVLEGSVRRAANRLRITGQLVEGTGGTHVWADKFDGTVDDIFDLQDRLTESIVGAIEPSMRRAEIERARRKRPDSLDAYDLFLQALPHAYANTPATTDEALRLLNASLGLDPEYAAAHAYASWSSEQRFFRSGFHPADKSAAVEHARTALRLGTKDPQALSIAAFVYASMTRDFETALGALDRALEMNSNSALAFGFSALVGAYTERYERVSEHALRALRLSPFDPLNYHPYWALACACLFTGRAADAVTYSKLAIQSNPYFSPLHVFLVVSHASLDNLEAARAAGRRLMETAPGFTISGFVRKDLFRPHVYQVIAAGLRQAGLPD